MITESEFRAIAAQGYNRIPLVLESFADLDTPLSLYVKLARQRDTFLLESVVGGERFGRYSFIGLPAKLRIRARGDADRGRRPRRRRRAPRRRPAGVRARVHGALPRRAAAGTATLLRRARRLLRLRHRPPHRATARRPRADRPVRARRRPRHPAAADRRARGDRQPRRQDLPHRLRRPLGARRLREARTTGCRRCAGSCATPVEIPFQTATRPRGPRASSAARASARRSRAPRSTSRRATSCRWCCRSGCRCRSRAAPLSLYRALRSLNPSPYMFYYDFGDFHVVGASPEILVRKEGRTVTLRPIAGTRPRGATREADEELAAELLADPKEIAEHVMLLDLGRNDVGRVAATGTVRVTEQMAIERYSHVMHIVSNVEGELAPGLDCPRRAARDVSGRHGDRRAEGARDGDHRRARADAARRLRRRGRLHRLPGRHGHSRSRSALRS